MSAFGPFSASSSVSLFSGASFSNGLSDVAHIYLAQIRQTFKVNELYLGKFDKKSAISLVV